MSFARNSFVTALAVLCTWCPASFANEASATKESQQPSTAASAADVPTANASRGEPKVQYTVIADDAIRIEEMKVRGQTQRITVSPKGLKSYEILPANQGRDMSEDASSQRGAAGKRVWHILTF